jgi:hypothetical protein
MTIYVQYIVSPRKSGMTVSYCVSEPSPSPEPLKIKPILREGGGGWSPTLERRQFIPFIIRGRGRRYMYYSTYTYWNKSCWSKFELDLPPRLKNMTMMTIMYHECIVMISLNNKSYSLVCHKKFTYMYLTKYTRLSSSFRSDMQALHVISRW